MGSIENCTVRSCYGWVKEEGTSNLIWCIFNTSATRGPANGHKLSKDIREGSELVARAWCEHDEACLTWQEGQAIEQVMRTFKGSHKDTLATTIVCSDYVADTAGTVGNSVVGEGEEEGSEEGCGANLGIRNMRHCARGAAAGNTASWHCRYSHRSSQSQSQSRNCAVSQRTPTV